MIPTLAFALGLLEAAGPSTLSQSGDAAALSNDVKVFGAAKALLGMHTHWEPLPSADPIENVVSARGRATLGLEWKASESLRVLVEARAVWRASAQHDFQRAKGYFEPQLGEAFVDLYTTKVDLRLGSQVIAFGANPTFAPSDRLNPRDFRESFLFGDPEDFKLPVFSARARGTIGRFDWTAVYAPFFSPDRYTVFGQDEAVIQPSLGLPVPARLDPSIEDAVQPHLLETERPNAFPYLGDLGLRVTTDFGPAKLGVAWVWFNEKFPALALDPQLASFLAQVTRGEPPNPGAAIVLQNRFLSGERLFEGKYPRQHVIAAELAWLLGSTELDLDLGYSPAQTFFDATFQSLRKPAVTWVLGFSQATDSPLFYSLTYVGFGVSSLEPPDRLFLLEPTSAGGSKRTALFHSFVGNFTYGVFDRKLQLGLRAAFEPVQRSFAAGPRITYRITDRLTALFGAQFFGGSALTPFGYFSRTEQLVAGIHADLF